MLAPKWLQQKRKVTRCAQDLYDAQCKRIGEYKVSCASETVAFVTKMNKNSGLRRRVDLQTSTCICNFIDQYAIPCRHLIAVLRFCEQIDSVIERFAPGCLVENYVMALRRKVVELPLDSALCEDPACAPPTSRRTETMASENNQDVSTRPRQGVKRAAPAPNSVISPNGGENQVVNTYEAPQRVRLCKKCRGSGHSSRSCSVVAPVVS